jgi:asparagine synthase (glutamine-hydrolysing)
VSGICGVLRTDGVPADATLLGPMLGLLDWRGGPARARWNGGPVALGAIGPAGAVPLARDDRSGLVVVFDGRLDDREGLLAALRERGEVPRDGTDAEAVLRAVAAFGDDAPDRILGDFALAAWDSRRRRLLLARDGVGIRPLFHGTAGDALAFGSDPRVPISLPGLSAAMDEGVVAEILAGRNADGEGTILRGVRRLPPGHALVAAEGGTRTVRWWRPEESRDRVVGSDEAIAEEFRCVAEGAVRARMRGREGAARVGVLLSGGIDSGLVAALARRTSWGPEPPRAYVGVAPGRAFDEGERAAATALALGLAALPVPMEPPSLEEYDLQIHRTGLPPVNPPGTLGMRLYRRAADEGRTVLLTGHGGDEWAGGAWSAIADHLRRGGVGAAVRESRRIARGDWTATARILLRHGLRPLVPFPVVRLKRALLPHPLAVPWIRPSFARRAGLAERVRAGLPGRLRGSREREEMLRGLRTGWWQDTWESLDRTSLLEGVDLRHPLMDRRVAEYCLSLPAEQRFRGRETKVVIRNAARGLLPEATRARVEKPHAGPVLAESLLALEDAGALEFGWLEEAGAVDGDVLRRMAGEMRASLARGDESYLPRMWPLWECFSIARWGTMVLDGRGSGVPAGRRSSEP